MILMNSKTLAAGLIAMELGGCALDLPEREPVVIGCEQGLIKEAFSGLQTDIRGVLDGIDPDRCRTFKYGESLVADVKTNSKSPNMAAYFPTNAWVEAAYLPAICDVAGEEQVLVNCGLRRKWVTCGFAPVVQATMDENEITTVHIRSDEVKTVTVDYYDVDKPGKAAGYGNAAFTSEDVDAGVYNSSINGCSIFTTGDLDLWADEWKMKSAIGDDSITECYDLDERGFDCAQLVLETQEDVSALLRGLYPTVFTAE